MLTRHKESSIRPGEVCVCFWPIFGGHYICQPINRYSPTPSLQMFLLVGPCDDSDSLRFVVVERSLLCVVRDFWNTAGCVVVVFGGLTDWLTGRFVDLLPLFLHSNGMNCQERAFLVIHVYLHLGFLFYFFIYLFYLFIFFFFFFCFFVYFIFYIELAWVA